MSEEVQPNSTNVQKIPTLEELADTVKQLQSTNNRLLDENKKYKERAKRVESEYEKVVEETTGKEKDVNKIIEAERKKADKIAAENKRLKTETLNSRIRAVVGKYASDVNDLDDLLNQPKYGEILKRGIDVEELSVDEDAAKEFVETVLKEKPYLRKQPEATTMMTRKPSFSQEKSKAIGEMSTKEIEELAHKLYGKK